ncbi:FUSC family protein [Actinomadura sp. NPDC023710]|uniref:FUSC family protein n=1 Tax=Actinomadura sp. NPDC023710 TaxID=3158219 RepID=UPI0033C78F63
MALDGARVRSAPPAAITMAAVLAAFGSALVLEQLAHPGVDAVVQAVVLTVTLAGAQRGIPPADRLTACVVMPLVALATAALGALMSDHRVAGDAAFVLLVTSAIWIRRFGRRFARVGTLMTLPAVALLVVPHAHAPGHVVWAPVMALIAWFWVTAFQLLADHVTATGPAGTEGPERRSPVSGRMAAQMAVALAAAFTAGHLLFPGHWSWVVLTAFIVCNGALGQGDALHKGFLRTLGAAGGTLLATLMAGMSGPGNRWSVALVFVVLGVAVWLRPKSYAYWAGGITAALALLYGYLGQSAMPLLWTRMEAILAGAVIGVASAWFVLPFRTGDVLRRRSAAALAVLPRALQGEPGAMAGFERSVADLDKLYPPLRTHRAITRQRPHQADVVDHLRDILGHLRAPPADGTAQEKIDTAVAGIRELCAPVTRVPESPGSARPDAWSRKAPG